MVDSSRFVEGKKRGRGLRSFLIRKIFSSLFLFIGTLSFDWKSNRFEGERGEGKDGKTTSFYCFLFPHSLLLTNQRPPKKVLFLVLVLYFI